jgi:hypothetical protein
LGAVSEASGFDKKKVGLPEVSDGAKVEWSGYISILAGTHLEGEAEEEE